MLERVLVTGANGFVGRAVLTRLLANRVAIRAATRRWKGTLSAERVTEIAVGDIGPDTDWAEALDGVDTIIHLVGRTHVMRETSYDPLQEYRKVNVGGTLRLAEQAKQTGVRRFVFVSSVKVNGEQTAGHAFSGRDKPNPQDAYGISKLEAEQALGSVFPPGEGVAVIVRPPLVHGPGVRANLLNLIRLVVRGVPLPLGAVKNRRSLIGVRNLADFLVLCSSHPSAGGKVFLVSDGEDVSVPDLVRRLAVAADRSATLIPVPPKLLLVAGAVLGRRSQIEKLTQSLQVDSSYARQTLGWVPPYGLDEELRRMVKDYLSHV